MSTIKRFLEPARIAWKPILSITLLDIFSNLCAVGLIYWTKYIVDAIESWDHSKFITRIIILASIAVIYLTLKILRKPYIYLAYKDLANIIDVIYLPKVISGDNNKYELLGTWRMIAIYGKGTGTWCDLIINVFCWFSWSIILFLAFIITIFQKNVSMFFWAVAMMVIIWVRFYLFWDNPYKRRKIAKDRYVDIQRMQVKWFMSKYEIMQQDKLQEELSKRIQINEEWYKAKWYEKSYQWIAFDVPIFIATMLFIFLIYFIWNQIFQQTLQLSDIVVIIWLWLAFIRDLEGLMRDTRVMIDRRIDVTRLRELVDSLKTDYEIEMWAKFSLWAWNIKFKNVSYGYGEGKNIITDFSLDIQAGKKTALVGVSGAGKTTLAKLIAGYIRTDKWSIIVDWQALNAVSLKSYYKHIGYLTQDPSVFDGTILENLTYVLKEKMEIVQLEKIIKLAKCEFIYTLPQGLNTEIGERWIRLSGWQRQRLAIAKIFLKNPEIIILDEPTSALDSFSEEWITEAMHNLFKDRTVIIIAHRLQTVKEADDIIVLDEGQVIERWKHNELVQLWWSYAKMLELQSGF